MADKKIFFAPSKPPRDLQWGGERIYFYNCHREGADFEWHKNNFELTEGNPAPDIVDVFWTFNNMWNPRLVSDQIRKEYKND